MRNLKSFIVALSIFIAIFFIVITLQIITSANFKDKEETYFNSTTYEFSGKLERFTINKDALGEGIMVAVEINIDYSYYDFDQEEKNCFVGVFDSERLIFFDYAFKGYKKNMFDSISIKSEDRSIYYFKNGKQVKKGPIRINCGNGIEERWFKGKIEDEPGTIF